MLKILLLSKLLNFFIQITEPGSIEHIADTLQPGEIAWVKGSLTDSYENKILELIGQEPNGKGIKEYKNIFKELDLKLEHLEIKHEMAIFKGITELKMWIYAQVNDDFLAESYLNALQEHGLIVLADGTIRFPTKHIVACLKKI